MTDAQSVCKPLRVEVVSHRKRTSQIPEVLAAVAKSRIWNQAICVTERARETAAVFQPRRPAVHVFHF